MSAPADPAGELTLVVAMSQNRVIGRGGALPWHEPEDLKHFKRVTMGHAMVLGKRTWLSIGRALPGRRMIVLSRQRDLALPTGVERAASLEEALRLARETDAAPCVIGGGDVYEQALPLATRIELTIVEREVEGDTFFPRLAESAWREIARTALPGLSFATLVRVPSRDAVA